MIFFGGITARHRHSAKSTDRRGKPYVKSRHTLRCIGKIYVKSRDSQSDLPPPPYGLNWGHKITDFLFLRYISFILAFRALEYIKRYWETICEESI